MIWCEHCRDHFPTDHYGDGDHRVGDEFGPTGQTMKRERELRLPLKEGASCAPRVLDDGRVLDVYPLLFGRARLLVGPPEDRALGFADDCWEYPSIDSAVTALQEWDGRGDAPYGWDRHPASGRRRPEGDATRERVAP